MAVAIIAILAVAFGLIRSKARSHASDLAGIGANEFLKEPPTSFPTDRPGPRATAAGVSPTVAAPATVPPAGDVDDDDDDDEAVISRFRAPGLRSLGAAGAVKPTVPTTPRHQLEPPEEGPDEAPTGPAPAAAEVATEVSSPAPAKPAHAAEEPAEEPAEDRGDEVIDLVAADAAVAARHAAIGPDTDQPGDATTDHAADQAEAWQEVTLAPEPDAVDHVLQALINRARFKQVDVEEVATELVERSDLHGDDVSDVLASLVGRADADVAKPSSELTLFNDEVPSRPGQLTDFAKLEPAEKKRIIVRVLCLLVARSEDQQLPPRADSAGNRTQSWPLARAVWPVAPGEDDATHRSPVVASPSRAEAGDWPRSAGQPVGGGFVVGVVGHETAQDAHEESLPLIGAEALERVEVSFEHDAGGAGALGSGRSALDRHAHCVLGDPARVGRRRVHHGLSGAGGGGPHRWGRPGSLPSSPRRGHGRVTSTRRRTSSMVAKSVSRNSRWTSSRVVRSMDSKCWATGTCLAGVIRSTGGGAMVRSRPGGPGDGRESGGRGVGGGGPGPVSDGGGGLGGRRSRGAPG